MVKPCNVVERLGHFDDIVPSLGWRQNNMASVVENTSWKHLEMPFLKLLIFKMSLDAWISCLITALDLLKSWISPKKLEDSRQSVRLFAWLSKLSKTKNAGQECWKEGREGPYFLFYQACSCNSTRQRQEPVEINRHHTVIWSRDCKGTACSLWSLKICSCHFRPKRSRLSSRHLLIKWLL